MLPPSSNSVVVLLYIPSLTSCHTKPLLSCLFKFVCLKKNQNCKSWAEGGECAKNPTYMLSDCAKSCDVVGRSGYDTELEGITSFFDLAAYDIHGEPIEFNIFKGQVTVVANVASECGYTDSHYRSLVKLWSSVKHTNQINILAFPCDQFGHQEPGSGKEILNFAVKEYGVEFTMMKKIDVNGNSASIVYVRIYHDCFFVIVHRRRLC